MECVMAGLLIRNLPNQLHRQLRSRAKCNQRSLSREAVVILQQALDERAGPPSLGEIDSLRVSGQRNLTQKLLDQALKTGRK